MRLFLRMLGIAPTLLIALIAISFAFGRCGKPHITSSAGSEVDGLPGNWDGSVDYEAEGWRFETP